MTVTLYQVIQSELHKKGLNEFVDEHGDLVFFDKDHQFMTKILSYDEDIQDIMNQIFTGISLNQREYDEHFKKGFFYRFINRHINRQTIEAFRLELLSTFMSNERFINRLYEDGDKFLAQTVMNDQETSQLTSQSHSQNHKQTNTQTTYQTNDGLTLSDNRNAFTDLPQNNVQIDVDDTVMTAASNNEISRNKQTNNQETDGLTDGLTEDETLSTTADNSQSLASSESKTYKLDELFKSNGLLDQVYNIFDIKCFMQVW